MKKTALSLAISILLFSTSSVVMSDEGVNLGFSQNESSLKLKKRFNLKKLKLTAEKLKKFGKKELADLKPEVLSFFSEDTIRDLPPEAFEGISVDQFSEIDAEGLKGLTGIQFDKIPSKVLKALNAEGLEYLGDDILQALDIDDLQELDVDLFKKVKPRELSKLLVNIGQKDKDKNEEQKVRPADLKSFLPEGWDIKDNGELIIPEGTDLALPAILNPQQLLAGVKFPRIANLKKGFGMGGVGKTFLSGMNEALDKAQLSQFKIDQDEEGILEVHDESGDSDFQLFFMPDERNIKQAKKGTPAGLSQDKRGFFVLTTEEGRKIPILPVPKKLKKIIGLEKVELGEAGDVLMKLAAGKYTFGIGLFDPVLTKAPNDLKAGVHFSEDDEAGTKPATVVYEDGTAQSMRPTIHKPEAFFKKAKTIPGVDDIYLNADGTLLVIFEGKEYILEPSFKVKESALPEGVEQVEPTIDVKEDGTIDYTIQNEQALLTIPLNIIAKE